MTKALILNQARVNNKVFHLPTILRDAICKYAEKQCLCICIRIKTVVDYQRDHYFLTVRGQELPDLGTARIAQILCNLNMTLTLEITCKVSV
jgi:hypothetical protein